ncbi:hypothetical protein [Halioxenophilus sp. WMMB6]|uniref:hypothetical protein n=1 Tax=Halioxenophilus sp. WMMB6 TaxID=3073815 RepID=UPI00295F4785|nr:hypothetical protein [Halioxenophilus sp. WMMB6]
MQKLACFCLAAGLTVVSHSTFAQEMQPDPILTVGDFNGDGTVDYQDYSKCVTATWKNKYIAFFDLNADGTFDGDDCDQAWDERGQASTVVDQEMAELYGRLGHLQSVDQSYLESTLWGQFGPALAGHGQHWIRQLISMGAYQPGGTANYQQPHGANLWTDRDEVAALWWGQAATPLFNDPDSPTGLSTLDWPDGTAWQDERPQAFADEPPKFTSSEHENWHTHGGMCLVTDPDTGEWYAQQLLSYNECQALPNAEPQLAGFDGLEPIYINPYVNVWMIHMWLFTLNPHGFFGNTNPNVDPGALDEDEINGGRPVPMWFMMHHMGH